MYNLFWKFYFGTFTVIIFTALMQLFMQYSNIPGTQEAPNKFGLYKLDFTEFRGHSNEARQKLNVK